METNSLTASGQPDELNGVDTHPTPSCSYQAIERPALAYAAAGLSVIPLKLDKTPAEVTSRKEFKSSRATEETIRQWYANGPPGVGIICGAISGNIECLDIDEKYNLDSTPLLDQLSPLVNAHISGLPARLVHETSVNGGHHFIYRCKSIEGSKNLARRASTESELAADPKKKSRILIETRGEGAYFACHPTPGYKLVSGSFTSIPEITEEERKILLECSRALNRYNLEERTVSGYPKKRIASIMRPGDDYNLRGDISTVLNEAGWKYVYSQGQTHT